jgi:hypothetical protein
MTIDWQMEADRANRLYGDASRRIEQLEAALHQMNDAFTAAYNTAASARIEQLEAALRDGKNWLRRNANAEKEPAARAAFIEAHNAFAEIARAALDQLPAPEESKAAHAAAEARTATHL